MWVLGQSWYSLAAEAAQTSAEGFFSDVTAIHASVGHTQVRVWPRHRKSVAVLELQKCSACVDVTALHDQ